MRLFAFALLQSNLWLHSAIILSCENYYIIHQMGKKGERYVWGEKSRDLWTLYLSLNPLVSNFFLKKAPLPSPLLSPCLLVPSQISRISYHFLSPLLLLLIIFFFIILQAQPAAPFFFTNRHHGTSFILIFVLACFPLMFMLLPFFPFILLHHLLFGILFSLNACNDNIYDVIQELCLFFKTIFISCS